MGKKLILFGEKKSKGRGQKRKKSEKGLFPVNLEFQRCVRKQDCNYKFVSVQKPHENTFSCFIIFIIPIPCFLAPFSIFLLLSIQNRTMKINRLLEELGIISYYFIYVEKEK